jgi:HD-like signal output (HDOD) protein
MTGAGRFCIKVARLISDNWDGGEPPEYRMSAAAPHPAPATPPPSSEALIRMALRKVTNIATLPEVTSRIIEICEDPSSNAQSLKKIVSHDPALATRLLRVVNSAFYGISGQVNSVDRAIVILGFNEVKSIAMASNLGNAFSGVVLEGPFSAKSIWKHCVAVAVCGRELARSSRKLSPRSGEAFLAGLIHDLGLLVHLNLHPKKLGQVCQLAHQQLEKGLIPVNFCALERDFIGVDHEQLGQALTELWRFPEVYQQVVGFHHRPKNARSESRDMTQLIYVADTLVSHVDQGFNLTAKSQQWDEAELPVIGLDSERLSKVAMSLPAQVEEASAIFE